LKDGCDPYAVVLIDHKEVARTKTVWNNREPVWDEDSFLLAFFFF